MSKSIFKENEINKSASFRQNNSLNDIISELSDLLKPIQNKKEREFQENKMPIGFLVGNPRSGTTLVLQWLASLGAFSFPTNVLNRFSYAPYLGALIQNMLFNSDYDFHNEFEDLKVVYSFKSNLGKTKGALAPSEFQHFFRNHMSNFDPEFLKKEALSKVDFKGIKRGLASVEQVLGKPFVLKNVMLQYNLLELFGHIPNSIFIYVQRDPIYNMQSLLLARENYYADRTIWWSVKPKEYEFLKEMDVYHQIAGQVYFSSLAIENSLKQVPTQNKFEINYESFCKNPETVYKQLVEKYSLNNFNISEYYDSVKSFRISDSLRISNTDFELLKKAYKYFEKGNSSKI